MLDANNNEILTGDYIMTPDLEKHEFIRGYVNHNGTNVYYDKGDQPRVNWGMLPLYPKLSFLVADPDPQPRLQNKIRLMANKEHRMLFSRATNKFIKKVGMKKVKSLYQMVKTLEDDGVVFEPSYDETSLAALDKGSHNFTMLVSDQHWVEAIAADLDLELVGYVTSLSEKRAALEASIANQEARLAKMSDDNWQIPYAKPRLAETIAKKAKLDQVAWPDYITFRLVPKWTVPPVAIGDPWDDINNLLSQDNISEAWSLWVQVPEKEHSKWTITSEAKMGGRDFDRYKTYDTTELIQLIDYDEITPELAFTMRYIIENNIGSFIHDW